MARVATRLIGIERDGSIASPPSVVILSNPTNNENAIAAARVVRRSTEDWLHTSHDPFYASHRHVRAHEVAPFEPVKIPCTDTYNNNNDYYVQNSHGDIDKRIFSDAKQKDDRA